MIPVFRPSIGDEEIQAVAEVLRSGWLGLGPKTKDFETEFAKAMQVDFAVGMSSATAALHLAAVALDLGPGDEVLVPTLTFVSTAHIVEYVGATPVFVDIEPSTLCMDLADAARKLTPRTRAIIPVHYGGRPMDLDRLHSFCDEHDLHCIEDAAHACGGSYQGRPIGSKPRPFVCFSFHAVKNLTCGEGGMVTTTDPELDRRLRELRWLGISRDTWDRSHNAPVYAWQYWVNSLGFKAHLSDVAAALGLVQLNRLKDLNARRAKIAAQYRRAFDGLDWIQVPPRTRSGDEHAWHLFHVRTERRDDLIAHLKKHDISPGVHYYPLHRQPYYEGRDHDCPVADRVWKEILTLPLFPDLSADDFDKVARTVTSFGEYLAWKRGRIESNGCVLREVESADLELMRSWRNHPDSAHAFFGSSPISSEVQLDWFNRYLQDDQDLMYVVETPEGTPIGTIGLKQIDRKQGCAELGRMLIAAGPWRRKGWGSRAVGALLEYALTTLGLHRVFLEVQEENASARALYASCGFVEEGVLRGAYQVDGVRRNKVIMAVVKDSS